MTDTTTISLPDPVSQATLNRRAAALRAGAARKAKFEASKADAVGHAADKSRALQMWHDVMVAQIQNGRCNTPLKLESASDFAHAYVEFAKTQFSLK